MDIINFFHKLKLDNTKLKYLVKSDIELTYGEFIIMGGKKQGNPVYNFIELEDMDKSI
jgi:hypothetical protein